MKSFIVAAMLVAAVAGQSFDMFKYGQEKSLLLNKQYGQNELLLKKLGYPVDKSLVYGQKDLVDLPFYLQNEKIFTIEELYTTQLFKEYLTLPLFRQFITYPAFQKYVQSIYFQKFWTVPEFKQYFVQPELFYKFVLPQIQLFTTNTFEQQIVNKNVLPFVADYEREQFVPTTTTYNKDYLLQDGLFYKNLLNKLYNQIYNVDETTTVKKIVDPITGEIKMIPFGIKGIEGIDTIFGDKLVKDVLLKKFLINKNVDIDSIFGDKLIFDLLLKKNVDFDLIKKIILTGNVELLDTVVFGDYKDLLLKKNVDVELLKDLLIKKNVDVELIKKLILTKMILGDNMNMYTNTMIPEEYLKEKMIYNTPIYNRMMYNKRFPVETFEGKMNLFDLLHKQEGLIVDPVEKMNVFDILSKKDLIVKDKILLNKILADKINEIDNFGTYETVVPKMYNDVTKFERIPLTLEGVKPMMGVRTFEDKKMIPELIKA